MFTLHVGLTGKMVNSPPTLLNWQIVHERMPWHIILLLGGGFALAAGSEVHTSTLCFLPLQLHIVFYIGAETISRLIN